MNESNNNVNWVLALTATASLMVALDVLVLSTALTEIGRAFSASVEDLEWTANAYILSFAVLLMTAAAVGDRFGRRSVFVAGLGLFVVASAACALAPGIGWLIAARAVQGVGAAMIMPLALALVSAAFPADQRGWALGIYSAVTGLSTVLGPVIGGAVTEGLAWEWVFWLNVPIGLLALVLTLGRVPESFGPRAKIDVPGVVLVTGAALGLVWGLVRAAAAGWFASECLVSLALGAALAVAFVAWEHRRAEPMMPMRLFGLRAFAAGNAAMFLLNAALFAAIFFMAQFLQVVLQQGPLGAGLQLLPWGVAVVLAASTAGALARRLGERATIVVGLTFHAIGLAWLALLARPGLAYAAMIVPMVVAGAGFAMAVPLVQKTVVGAVAAEDIGKASGTLSMIRQLGGAFGIAVTVAAFAAVGGRATLQAFADGFAAAIGVAAALSLVGAIAACCLPGRSSLGAHDPGAAARTSALTPSPTHRA